MENLIELLFFNSTTQKFVLALVGSVLIIFSLKIIKKKLFSRVKTENWYKTGKALNILGYALVILLLGIVFNDRLGGLTVTLGFAGAGVAFALREVITSVAGWLAIVAGGFYKTGDRVQLGGIKGDVIDIGILRTTVMELGQWVDADLYNGRVVRIANSFVFSQPVFNYSADFPFLWDEIKIPIRYGSDYQLAQQILEKSANSLLGDYIKHAQADWDRMVKKFIIENESLKCMVTVETTDNWVEFTLRYVVEYRRRRSVKSALFAKILAEIDSTDGAVKFASSTVEIVETPEKHGK